MLFVNGSVPESVVSVVLGSGRDSKGRYWEFRCTPAFAARWAFAKKYALDHFGRTIYIRSGANLYRNRAWQVIARNDACASGNCNGASAVGYSSHGGNWQGQDCLAVDVDPNGLSWDQVDKAMSAAGFAIRMITEAMSGIRGGERWHYIDFNAFGPVPSGSGATPFQEDDMSAAAEAQILAIYQAIFPGGPSMPDGGRGIGQSLADIQAAVAPIQRDGKFVSLRQEIADAKTGVLALLGRPIDGSAVDVDEAAIAVALAPLLTANIGGLSDEDVKRLAVAAADENDRRDRERLG